MTNTLANISKKTANMLDLPNEILDMIAAYVIPNHTIEVMEGIPRLALREPKSPNVFFESGESSAARVWSMSMQDARNFALVCRRFKPVMERWMYNHISVLEDFYCDCCNQYPRTALPNLVRTLMARPDLARRCVRLDTWMRDRRLISKCNEQPEANPYHETFKIARLHAMVVGFKTLGDKPLLWLQELEKYQEAALHAVLISLLPNLKDLRMHGPLIHAAMFRYVDPAREERPLTEPIDPRYFDTVLKKSSLTSIHVGIPWPIKHFPRATLTTMEVDILFFADRIDLIECREMLPNVHTVAVIINFAIFVGRNLDAHTPRQKAYIGLQLFLRYIVPNVKHFSIEMPRGKLEYAQTMEMYNRQGEPLPAFINMNDDMQDIEETPVDNGHERTAWDWLLRALLPVKTTLISLSVPRNWYSSTGFMVKSMPSLSGFTNLETLSLPRVALVSNSNSLSYHPSDDCAAVDFLPKNLKTLVIFQADVDSCEWVQAAFAEKHLYFKKWQNLGLAFRNDIEATLTPAFGVEAGEAGLEVRAFWRGQYKVVAWPK